MSLPIIKKALEKRLNTLAPALSTAYENDSFTPVNGTPYQRAYVVPRRPENPTVGDDYYREVGEFQVFLCYPTNEGTGNVLARAEATKRHFKRGTVLQEGGLNIIIQRTPTIAGSTIAGNRIVVPVLITYYCDIFNA